MNMFRVEFKKISKGLIIWMVILCGLILMYLAFYNTMKELFMQKMELVPDDMLSIFRMGSWESLAGFGGYYSAIFTFVVLGASCYAMITGVSLLIREEGDGTIEFLNAMPVTRSRIVTAKLLATSCAMLLLSLAMAAASYLGGMLFAADTDYSVVVLGISRLVYIPVFVFLCMGMLLSALLKKANSATPLALGLFFMMYILGSIAGMVEPLEWLRWLSPLDYLSPNGILNSSLAGGVGRYDYAGLYISIALILVSVAGTYVIYRRKDLAA